MKCFEDFLRWVKAVRTPQSLRSQKQASDRPQKVVLCFGDSNTWGHIPATGLRYSYRKRWTGILQRKLGKRFRLIEDGLSGRTTAWDDPLFDDRNGMKHLRGALRSHAPIDLVVIMLGTNDLKHRFALSAREIAEGAGMLAQLVYESHAGISGDCPKVLLVIPPPVNILPCRVSLDFEGAIEKSKEFSIHYKSVAERLGCSCFDSSEVVMRSEIDGIHLDKKSHRLLGEALANVIRGIE